MYARYLNNNDYKSVISPEALDQITRSDETAIFQAEEDSEASIREYLTDNYMIEEELESGKALVPYDRRITYPPGVHFYFEGQIVQSMMRINGCIAPAPIPFWITLEEYLELLNTPVQPEPEPSPSNPGSSSTAASTEPQEPSQNADTSSTEETNFREVEKAIVDIVKAVEARNLHKRKNPSLHEIRRRYLQLPKPLFDISKTTHDPKPYSQLVNYEPGSLTAHSGRIWVAMLYNGPDYDEIRIPGVNAWEEVEYYDWEPNVEYSLFEVAKFDGRFYALVDDGQHDLTRNPFDSDYWAMIGDYDPKHKYDLEGYDFAVYEDAVWRPVSNPNADDVAVKRNVRYNDPRNSNVKKHLVRLALYELYKKISPNNVSSARITDYETSIAWLRDANRCKINPGIPRKLDRNHKPVSEVAVATFVNRFDPRENMWLV